MAQKCRFLFRGVVLYRSTDPLDVNGPEFAPFSLAPTQADVTLDVTPWLKRHTLARGCARREGKMKACVPLVRLRHRHMMIGCHEVGGQKVGLGREQPNKVVDVLVLAGGRFAGVVEVSMVDHQPSLACRQDNVRWCQPFCLAGRNRAMGACLDAVLNLRNDKVDVRRWERGKKEAVAGLESTGTLRRDEST